MTSTNVSAEEKITKIKELLAQAVDTYNSMCTANKWHIPHATHCGAICWNCGDDNHGVGKCSKPKDQKEINENKKIEENREKKGPGTDGGPSGGYSRNKWGSRNGGKK